MVFVSAPGVSRAVDELCMLCVAIEVSPKFPISVLRRLRADTNEARLTASSDMGTVLSVLGGIFFTSCA